MRIHVKKDNLIKDETLDKVLLNIKDIFSEVDIEVSWDFENRWFKHYEWEDYYDDQTGMRKDFLRAEANGTKKALGTRYDILLFCVHKDNWVPSEDGIWGWNLSQSLSGFHTTQARFDNESWVNSQGTIYHEIMHTLDQTIYSMLGKRVEEYLNVLDFDDSVVHGEDNEFDYIRFNENQDVLPLISDDLKRAYSLREQIYRLEQSGGTDKIKALIKNAPIAYRKYKWGKKPDIPTTPKIAKRSAKLINK